MTKEWFLECLANPWVFNSVAKFQYNVQEGGITKSDGLGVRRMIDLNKITQKLDGASWKHSSEKLLSDCMGNAVEAAEAYTQLKLPYDDSKGCWIEQYAERKHVLGVKLADVVTSCMIIAAREEIDMEYMLTQCLEKNTARANGDGDKK